MIICSEQSLSVSPYLPTTKTPNGVNVHLYDYANDIQMNIQHNKVNEIFVSQFKEFRHWNEDKW